MQQNDTILYLLRHGETFGNVEQILQGWQDGKLNEQGIAQAEQAREKLRAEHIDIFIASDLQRAIDTCQIIAEPHHLAVTPFPLLRERDWGSFTGKFIPSIQNAVWPDDVETLDHLRQRAADLLNEICEKYAGKTVLAVGHGIINKAIHSVYYGLPMNQIQKMMNGEIRQYVLDPNKHYTP